MSDDQELNERMAEAMDQPAPVLNEFANLVQATSPSPLIPNTTGHFSQWATDGGIRYRPVNKTAATLHPGLYEIGVDPATGIYFQRMPVKTEGLLRFPHTNCDRVLSEIQTFWEKRAIFDEYGLVHKRGILLWGPPGSGKSCTARLLLQDVVERGGIALNFHDPMLFSAGFLVLREIQRDTPVVVFMEDLDAIVRRSSESDVLNILDGVQLVDRAVFLATTNYPEMLGPRILNRPSRFDKRFKVGHPTAESRLMYLDHLIGRAKSDALRLDLAAWAHDTEGFSLAHLKELFIAVVILGDEYTDAIKTLRSMKENITSESDRSAAGFLGAGGVSTRSSAMAVAGMMEKMGKRLPGVPRNTDEFGGGGLA